MNALTALAYAGATAAALFVSGYAVVGWFPASARSTRLLAAPMAGLALVLWNVSVINAFVPLRAGAAWLSLWPVAVVLLTGRVRALGLGDVRAAAADRRVRAVAAGTLVLVALLLWPLVSFPDLVFFDGTSNHDNFFWVLGAEYLRSHVYLQPGDMSSLPTVFQTVPAFLGPAPAWGRMGAEGLTAAFSAVLGTSPIRWYVGGTVALVIPWLAAVLALVRSIGWLPRSPWVLGAGCALQPLCFFFLANGNLPNLLGAIGGGALLWAVHLASAGDRSERRLGFGLIALSVHGILVSYPEIMPFAALPAGLLVLWRAAGAGGAAGGTLIARLAAAGALGLLLNGWTVLRAWRGFASAFAAARADEGWPNLFADLSPASWLPALLTLATDPMEQFGPSGGAVTSIVLVAMSAFALRRASQRPLALVSLTGCATLVAYTLATDFSYGWQKAAQFAAVPLAAWYPFGVAAPWARPTETHRRILAGAAVVALWVPAGWGVYDLAAKARTIAADKGVTSTMLALRDAPPGGPQTPLLVEGRTFRMPYFQSMWAVYVLAGNRLEFPAAASQDGGYLADSVTRRPADAAAPVVAGYFGREWADAFSTGLPRWSEDRLHAVLPRWNNVEIGTGFLPSHAAQGLKGVPRLAGRRFELVIQPLQDAIFTLRLRAMGPGREAWAGEIVREGDAVHPSSTVRTSADARGVMEFQLPVPAGAAHRIRGVFRQVGDAARTDSDYPFAVERIRVYASPPPTPDRVPVAPLP